MRIQLVRGFQRKLGELLGVTQFNTLISTTLDYNRYIRQIPQPILVYLGLFTATEGPSLAPRGAVAPGRGVRGLVKHPSRTRSYTATYSSTYLSNQPLNSASRFFRSEDRWRCSNSKTQKIARNAGGLRVRGRRSLNEEAKRAHAIASCTLHCRGQGGGRRRLARGSKGRPSTPPFIRIV